jgi:putative redox protein
MLIELKRVEDDFSFEAKDTMGHTVQMDSGSAFGGHDLGVRPMQLLLMGLGGCSAIDIVSILKKQKQRIDDFSIQIDGNREDGKEPSLWENVTIRFLFKGEIDEGKAQRAVELSMTKYCSVAETLRKSGTHLSWTVAVN